VHEPLRPNPAAWIVLASTVGFLLSQIFKPGDLAAGLGAAGLCFVASMLLLVLTIGDTSSQRLLVAGRWAAALAACLGLIAVVALDRDPSFSYPVFLAVGVFMTAGTIGQLVQSRRSPQSE
jgi:hypothetical protein